MIEARELTKRYGDKTVVDRLSFTVKPGEVTGFLGPNGAGKSTTMRMILGLDAPTGGSVTVNGRPYVQHTAPPPHVAHVTQLRGASAQLRKSVGWKGHVSFSPPQVAPGFASSLPYQDSAISGHARGGGRPPGPRGPVVAIAGAPARGRCRPG